MDVATIAAIFSIIGVCGTILTVIFSFESNRSAFEWFVKITLECAKMGCVFSRERRFIARMKVCNRKRDWQCMHSFGLDVAESAEFQYLILEAIDTFVKRCVPIDPYLMDVINESHGEVTIAKHLMNAPVPIVKAWCRLLDDYCIFVICRIVRINRKRMSDAINMFPARALDGTVRPTFDHKHTDIQEAIDCLLNSSDIDDSVRLTLIYVIATWLPVNPGTFRIPLPATLTGVAADMIRAIDGSHD